MGSVLLSSQPVILIVEDEAILRLNAVEMLEDAGFQTIEAANADEAVRILETRDDIRAVFTDIEMPGSMDGLRLAAAIRNRWPPITLIVTSGKYHLSADELPPGSRFLPKPYDVDNLVQAVQSGMQ